MDAMNVSTADLVQMIGQQQIEIAVLRTKLGASLQRVADLEAAQQAPSEAPAPA